MSKAKVKFTAEGNAVFAGAKVDHCSFCGRQSIDVKWLVSGPRAMICDKCILICVEMMFDKLGRHK